ncbi:MAG: hypothetical protein SNH79_07575 [Rikenellaceae bacterium]
MTTIKRFFYPIGQGAFYAEKHPNFTFVYDCGNLKNTVIGNNVIKQAFDKNDVIDILFISHLDYDHISKIDKLKSQVNKIKCVILPLLYPDEKSLMLAIYKAVGYEQAAQFINSPKDYFGDDTKVILIEPTDDNEPIIKEEQTTFADIMKDDYEVKSGTIIGLGYDWVLIPYNHEYISRHNDLRTKLTDEGYIIPDLRNDAPLILKKLTTPAERNRLKNAYAKLTDGINANSMLLYSGPSQTHQWRRRIFYGKYEKSELMHFYYWLYNLIHHKNTEVGCVYTGDSDLNITKISTIFGNYWRYIGTIQIPHHGSRHNFDIKQIKPHTICPISVGENSFGHPSFDIISELCGNDCIPICVKDSVDDLYVEEIIL